MCSRRNGSRGRSEDQPTPQSQQPRFQGTGYTLGSDEQVSRVIPASQERGEENGTEIVTRFLTFWRNGFSVDDGPLLSYDDPANKHILEAIHQGCVYCGFQWFAFFIKCIRIIG